LFLTLQPPLPPRIGEIDFRAYWSASYLLRHNENFADPARLFQIEQTHTGWHEDYPMVAWNPPWLFVLLLPYALVPFARAVWLWLLTSIVLVFVSALLLWQRDATNQSARRHVWIPTLAGFVFSPTLTALIAGQVNILVLFGLAGYLFFAVRRRDGMAGALLALTTVKPQLIYVTVPILLLDSWRASRLRVLAGFAIVLVGLSIVFLVMRPMALGDSVTTIVAGRLLDWETPTLGGVLAATLGWQWAKLMGLAIMPLAVLAWWKSVGRLDTRTLVDVTLLASVITAPFGWSYDFVVLLVPLMRVIAWIVDGALRFWDALLIVLVLLASNMFAFYERVLTPSEIYFVWMPLVVAGVYTYAFLRRTDAVGELHVSNT